MLGTILRLDLKPVARPSTPRRSCDIPVYTSSRHHARVNHPGLMRTSFVGKVDELLGMETLAARPIGDDGIGRLASVPGRQSAVRYVVVVAAPHPNHRRRRRATGSGCLPLTTRRRRLSRGPSSSTRRSGAEVHRRDAERRRCVPRSGPRRLSTAW